MARHERVTVLFGRSYVWVRNDRGRLELVSVDRALAAARKALDALDERRRQEAAR